MKRERIKDAELLELAERTKVEYQGEKRDRVIVLALYGLLGRIGGGETIPERMISGKQLEMFIERVQCNNSNPLHQVNGGSFTQEEGTK